MDIERLIIILIFSAIFIPILIVLLKLLLFLKKHKVQALQKAANFCLLLIVCLGSIFVGGELLSRLLFFLRDGEPYILVYPFRAYTRNYLNLSYTPMYYSQENGKEEENVVRVDREYQGLFYTRAVQNRRGFRVPAFYNYDNYHIICIGGSATWGHNSDGQTYPDYLGKFLGQSTSVFNLGKRAHDSANYLHDLIKSGLSRELPQIDMAILYCGHNDTRTHGLMFDADHEYGEIFCRATDRYPLIKYSLFYRTLALLQFTDVAKQIFHNRSNEMIEADKSLVGMANEKFKTNLTDFIQFLKQDYPKIKILLVPEYTNYEIPIVNYLEQDFAESSKIPIYQYINYEFLCKHKIMQELAANDPNITFVKIDFFKKFSPQKLLMDRVHLTSFGNRVLAENLAKVIKPIMQ